ncbi:MAG: hypothetical protein JNL08_21490 [Planctomycetes bacterium]|nr:hypothetical protein [Planctomycetota bacterium]
MRLCPSVEGSASPLITHRIGTDVCLARQRTFFHKCHRCIYRGQAADWEPAEAPLAMLNVHTAEEPGPAEVKKVAVPRPPKAEPAVAAAAAKPKAKKPVAAKRSAPSANGSVAKAAKADAVKGATA